MKNRGIFTALLLIGIIVGGVAVSGSLAVPAGAANGPTPASIRVYSAEKGGYVMTQTVVKTNEEWRKTLTPSSIISFGEGDGAGLHREVRQAP